MVIAETYTDQKVLENSIQPIEHSVLFVDDEEAVLKALKRALRSEAFNVFLAIDGEEALRVISEHQVQIIVSDMSMPEMDGVTLLTTVQRIKPDIVRLALSGKSDADVILDAINNGSIYRYILKPWDDDQLKITVRQALELWDLQWERKQLLEKLAKHNQELEELVEQRTRQVLKSQRQADIGRYASQIVHNLRSPLHNVSAVIDLLATFEENQSLDKQNLVKWLNIARSAVNDLRDIIGGILNHARENESMMLVPLEVNRLVENEMKFFEMMPEFKYDIGKKLLLDDRNPQLKASPLHIKQILANLIKNALDAMESVQDKLLCVETLVDGEHVQIRVSDTGEGIALEHIPKLFSSDFTTKPADKGTGLGLASVKSMVDAYNGTIEVESVVGKGSVFKVYLPALNQRGISI